MPYVGVLVWSWLSYMNPHRLSYGFAYDAPFAYITAIILLMVVFFTKEKQKIPINTVTIIWLVFIGFMGVTTFFAYFPSDAWVYYVKIIKIQLIVFLTMILITDIHKLNQLIWVICLSIGYFSVKGGLFTILTGGGYKVYGPPDSFIGENNALAVAILMTIPLMIYLWQITSHRWLRMGLLGSALLSFACALGTQSRGALVAFSAVCLFIWLKSRNKLMIGVGLGLFVILLVSFMPAPWHNRMQTIETYEEDASAMGRINAWAYALNGANDNLFGMGLNSWNPITFAIYAPVPDDVHAAHSIYFSVLADHGWLGLIMFVLIYFLTWRKLSRIINNIDVNSEGREIALLARMLQVSFIAYLVGAAFLSLAYFDLPWHLVSFVILLERFSESKVRGNMSPFMLTK
jgi:probable O-glycosylation ligase (exosortase A-associated)